MEFITQGKAMGISIQLFNLNQKGYTMNDLKFTDPLLDLAYKFPAKAPKGYEYTGEIRAPNYGEHYVWPGNTNRLMCAGNEGDREYPPCAILKPVNQGKDFSSQVKDSFEEDSFYEDEKYWDGYDPEKDPELAQPNLTYADGYNRALFDLEDWIDLKFRGE